MKLTDSTIRDAVCPAGQKDVLLFDDALAGFGIRVTRTDRRIFIFQYRSGAKVRRTTLGEWGIDLTPAQARKRAEALRGRVREGRDPVFERREEKAARDVAEAGARAAMAATAYTVDRLITDWTEHHLVSRSASYQKRVPGELRRALKAWLVAPAAMFGRTDAVRVLDAVKVGSGPVAANRLRAEARACWTWAVKRGALDANPWEATPRPLARETARERVLSDAEIGALYRAANDLTEPFGALIRMMILTGQRRGEVAGMEFGELNFSTQVWHLPGSRTKNHQPHSVPLAPAAVDLVRGIRRREGARLVFEGPRQTVPSGFGKIKARLDAALALGESWILHDIRRTVATGLQRLGVRLEVTEAVLNHVSGSRSGIVGVYQRHGWEQEKRAALDAWAHNVLRAAEGQGMPDNAVPLRAGGSHASGR